MVDESSDDGNGGRNELRPYTNSEDMVTTGTACLQEDNLYNFRTNMIPSLTGSSTFSTRSSPRMRLLRASTALVASS